MTFPTRRALNCARLVAAVIIGPLAACAPKSDVAPPAETVDLEINRPTVIAYFIVPNGAVDTMPDLAVSADDWNYAMATLGDSVQAAGFTFALMTSPSVRLVAERSSTQILKLGEPFTAGYAFVRSGEPPCVRRSSMDPDSVVAVARAVFAGRAVPDAVCSLAR